MRARCLKEGKQCGREGESRRLIASIEDSVCSLGNSFKLREKELSFLKRSRWLRS